MPKTKTAKKVDAPKKSVSKPKQTVKKPTVKQTKSTVKSKSTTVVKPKVKSPTVDIKIPLTDTILKKLAKERCTQCLPEEKDDELCASCEIHKMSNIRNAIIRYCKSCRNGNPLDVCVSKDCPYYKIMPVLLKEISDKLQGAK